MGKRKNLNLILAVILCAVFALFVKLFSLDALQVFADNGLIAPLFGENSVNLQSEVIKENENITSKTLNGTIDSDIVVSADSKIIIDPKTGDLTFSKRVNIDVYGTLIIGDSQNVYDIGLDNAPIFIDANINVYGSVYVYALTSGATFNVFGNLYAPIYFPDLYNIDDSVNCYNLGNFLVNEYFILPLGDGADFHVGANMYALNGQVCVQFLGKNGLINLLSGKVNFSYDYSKSIKTAVGVRSLKNVIKTTIKINADAKICPTDFLINNTTYSSKDRFFPIPYNYDLVLESGMLDIGENAKLKLLPGANFNILNGTLNVYGALTVYSNLHSLDRFGYFYPDTASLIDNGFNGFASFINNGVLNIFGTFAGIVQTQSLSATITAHKGAKLSVNLSEGFDYLNFPAKLDFTLDAQIFGVNSYSKLIENKTYKSWAISPFSQHFVTYDSIKYGDTTSENVQFSVDNLYSGRFLIYQDNKFYDNLNITIGESVKNVCVNVNGTNYYTDTNGTFNATVEIESPLNYFTVEKENGINTFDITIDTPIVLDKVIKNVKISEDTNFTVYDVLNPVDMVINFYGGKSQTVSILPTLYGQSEYVLSASFTHEKFILVNSLSAKFYFVTDTLKNHKNAVNGLIDSLSIINDAQNLYKEYQNIINLLSYEEVEFINGFLDLSYFDIVCGLSALIEYGDSVADATLTTISGKKTQGEVSLSNYTFDGASILANASYVGNFKDTTYSLNKQISTVKSRAITLKIDNQSSAYGEDIKPLTANIISGNLVDGDTDIYQLFTTAKRGDNVRLYTIYGKALSPFYNITFINGTYEIVKKSVNIVIKDCVIDINSQDGVCIEFLQGNDDCILCYNVLDGDKTVAIIDLSGNFSQKLSLGTYKIVPITDDINYSAYVSAFSLDIVNGEYIVDFGATIFNKVYDGTPIKISLTVKDKTGQAVQFSTQIYMGENLVSQMVDAGEYKVVVTAGEFTKTYKFTITPCAVNLTLGDIKIYYGDDLPKIEYTVDVLVGDIFEFTLEQDLIRAKSLDKNFTVKSLNYNLQILPRPITIDCETTSKVYGDIEKPLFAKLIKGTLKNQNLQSVVTLVRDMGETVGSYNITPIYDSQKYDVTLINNVFKILPRNITVAVKNTTAYYGDTFTLGAKVISGYIFDDIGDIISLSVNAKNVGKYQIVANNINANYTVDFVNASLTILKRPITIDVLSTSKIYGDGDSLILSAQNIPYGESVYDIASATRVHGENVGEYKITVKAINDNYDVSFNYDFGDHSVFTILKRDISVKIQDLSCNFLSTLSQILSGIDYTILSGELVNGDNLNLNYQIYNEGESLPLSSNFFGNFNAVGNYIIKATWDNENYNLSVNFGTLTVTKITIEFVNLVKEFTYNGQDFSPFDYQKNLQNLHNLATQNSFAVQYYFVENDSNLPVNFINGAGTYWVFVTILDSHLYQFKNGENSYQIVVKKADLSDNLSVDFGYSNFIVIGENRPIAQLFGYDLPLKVSIFDLSGNLSDYLSPGKYKIVVEIIDNNYTGGYVSYFWAYESVKEDINRLNDTLNEDNDLYLKLSKAHQIVASLNDGDWAQINENSAYKPVIDTYCAMYNDYYQNYLKGVSIANSKVSSLVGIDISLFGLLSLLLIRFIKVIK